MKIHRITKQFVLLPALICSMASCSNGDMVPQQTQGDFVSFAEPKVKLTATQTRAVVEGSELPNSSSFGVLGYCLAYTAGTTNLDANTGPRTWYTKRTLAVPHVFRNLQVTKNGATCTYTAVKGTTTQQDVKNGLVAWYPQNDYRYTFMAYYPYSGWSVPAINKTGEPAISYSLSDISNNPDLMVDSKVDMMRGAGSVKFEFKHLMTGLVLKINNYDSGKQLNISQLEISGTFHKKVSISTDLNPVVSETFPDSHSFGSQAVPASSSKELAPLLFLPKPQSPGVNNIGSDIKISISYTSLQDGVNRTQVIPFPDWTSFNPQPGFMYTLQLTFKGDALLLDIIDANNGLWEGGSSVDSDITFS